MKSFLFAVIVLNLILSSCSQRCQPVECVTTSTLENGTKKSVTEFWVYDGQGRLKTDSFNDPDTMFYYAPAYYSYTGDSIIEFNYRVDALVLQTNRNGLPVNTFLQVGNQLYRAFYNQDGTIQKITSSWPVRNDNGQLSSENATVDSIIYSGGNIIAFRMLSTLGYGLTVKCSYYADKYYRQPFNPTYKIFALCGDAGGASGQLNVQVFSKNLLKTMESEYTRKSYEYQLDSQGKVVSMQEMIEGVGQVQNPLINEVLNIHVNNARTLNFIYPA